MDSGRSTAQDHLRVLQVTPRYAPSVGGVETHVREVARRLPARNVETAVLTPDPSGSLPAHEVLDGVTVHRVDARPRGRDYMFAPGLCGAIGTAGGTSFTCSRTTPSWLRLRWRLRRGRGFPTS